MTAPPSPVLGLVTWQSSCSLLFTGQAAAVGQEKVYSHSSTALMNSGLELCNRQAAPASHSRHAGQCQPAPCKAPRHVESCLMSLWDEGRSADVKGGGLVLRRPVGPTQAGQGNQLGPRFQAQLGTAGKRGSGGSKATRARLTGRTPSERADVCYG